LASSKEIVFQSSDFFCFIVSAKFLFVSTLVESILASAFGHHANNQATHNTANLFFILYNSTI
jgi:hypothetical protein